MLDQRAAVGWDLGFVNAKVSACSRMRRAGSVLVIEDEPPELFFLISAMKAKGCKSASLTEISVSE